MAYPLPALTLALLAVESFLTTTEGVRLFVRTTGGATGGPVVFLHGGPGGSMTDGGYEMEELLPERRHWLSLVG